MNKTEKNTPPGTIVETDVLVLGGGLAGTFAALAAREQGRQVLIVDKANVTRSGEAGAGNDHFCAHLGTNDEWDTEYDMADFLSKVSDKFIDPLVAINVARAIPTVRDILEQMGIEFHRDAESRDYKRTISFGARGPYWMMVKSASAKQLKPILVNALNKKGVRVLNRVMATKLLVNNGQVAGVTAFGVRDGQFYTIRAKSVILATGNISRTCAESATHNPFNIWRSPFNTGDGHAMAWNAGIEMEDMGILGGTLLPKGFGTPGVNGLVGNGAYLVNALGERYMFKYTPKGEGAERSTLVLGTFREIQEGRGPCYFDLRHLPPDVITFIRKNLLSVDRDTFDDFLTQKGLDPTKDLMEYEVGEQAKWCGGIAVSPDLETNLPRIYAAGQCGVGDTFSVAAASGWLAGGNAAQACGNEVSLAPIDDDEIAQEHARVNAPLARKDGLTPAAFERMVRQVNEQYLGVIRSDRSAGAALESLQRLAPYADQIVASNYHELMRAHEALNLMVCSELIAMGTIDRKESRFGSGFCRSDFPATDPAQYGMWLTRKTADGIVTRFQPIDPDALEKMRRGS